MAGTAKYCVGFIVSVLNEDFYWSSLEIRWMNPMTFSLYITIVS